MLLKYLVWINFEPLQIARLLVYLSMNFLRGGLLLIIYLLAHFPEYGFVFIGLFEFLECGQFLTILLVEPPSLDSTDLQLRAFTHIVIGFIGGALSTIRVHAAVADV